MLLHVCHIDIRRGIKYLQAFAGLAVESGDDVLSGIGDVSAIGTETEIDAARDTEFAQLTVLVEDCSTARTTDVHHTQLRTLVSERVAVHAAVLQLFIMTDSFHLEVLYTTLLDLDLIPYLIVGLDETISEIRIHLVADNVPLEGLVLYPLPVDQSRDDDVE